MKRKFILLGILSLSITLYSQNSIQYNHFNPLKFTLTDFNSIVLSVIIDNPKTHAIYQLLDDKKNKICEINFKNISLKKGINRLNYNQGQINWFNSPYRDMLLKDQLINGNFQVCVLFTATDLLESTEEVKECFDIDLKSIEMENSIGVRPIELNLPENKDSIDELRPLLTWIPPSPVYNGTFYHLILTEKKENQTCIESINNNIPIINKKSILSNILNYPSESQPLEPLKKYCWRVSAYTNEKEYTKSEEWEFVVKGNEEKLSSLPFIDDLDKTHSITNRESIHFLIDNRENERQLDLIIEFFTHSKWEKIKFGEIIILKYGLNAINIPSIYFNNIGDYRISVNNINNKNYQWKISLK